MGLFEKIFGNFAKVKDAMQTFQTLTAYAPAFTSWNGAIYEAALVRAAIDAKARHVSKMGVTFLGSAKPALQSRLRQRPNFWQTWSQWLYRTSTILDVENTAFIIPLLDDYGAVSGIYTVLPSMCELVQYQDTVYLRFTFSSGKKAAIEFDRCGVLTKFQYRDDFFGESNESLTPTMEVIHAQNEGIKEGVQSAATYRFMARMNNFTKPEDLATERRMFTESNFRSGSGGGLLLFPNTYNDIRQIESKPFTVDASQMALINGNIQSYFGVSDKVMQNTANDEEMDAFFNGIIEPFSIQVSQVVTGMLFSDRERALHNEFMLTANRLQYMSVQHKINLITQLGDRGMILIDEARELLNYAPLPEGAGQKAPIRGEYYYSQEKAKENGG